MNNKHFLKCINVSFYEGMPVFELMCPYCYESVVVQGMLTVNELLYLQDVHVAAGKEPRIIDKIKLYSFGPVLVPPHPDWKILVEESPKVPTCLYFWTEVDEGKVSEHDCAKALGHSELDHICTCGATKTMPSMAEFKEEARKRGAVTNHSG